jgi:hypothetical protein
MDTVTFKNRTADVINSSLEPIRQKYTKLVEDSSLVVDVLSKGRDDARKIARENLDDLKEKLGFYMGKR